MWQNVAGADAIKHLGPISKEEFYYYESLYPQKAPIKLSSRVVVVFDFLKTIPRGMVVTYGMVAKRCGVPCARNVGWILKQNTKPVEVPCYRVVRADGRLATGYKFGGSMGQRKRLLADGVIFDRNGKIKII